MVNEILPCVVGLGKLGLPLAVVIADSGFRTVCLDRNETHVLEIQNGLFHSPEPELDELLDKNHEKLKFGSNFAIANDCNIYFLIVPTPSMTNGKFDNSFLESSITSLLLNWRDLTGEKTIVIVSTVMPGTCNNVLVPKIRKWEIENGNKLRINLLYSPEFIALGTVIHNLRYPDMTLVGCEANNETEVFLTIMNKVVKHESEVQILNLMEAEIVKLLVNCFVTMKISFANFIGEISTTSPAINKYVIAQALGMDTRIGNKYLRPGLGFAGPCFPRDNTALIAFASEYGIDANLAKSTEEINSRQPSEVLKQVCNTYPNAKLIGIVGVAYKPYTSVIDESQTLKIANLVRKAGLSVKLYDPQVTANDLPGYSFADSISELRDCDVVIVNKEFEKFLGTSISAFSNILVV
jgi:UDPglucose 6-dehydrogenase